MGFNFSGMAQAYQGYAGETARLKHEERLEADEARRVKNDERADKDSAYLEEQRTRQRTEWSDIDAEKEAEKKDREAALSRLNPNVSTSAPKQEISQTSPKEVTVESEFLSDDPTQPPPFSSDIKGLGAQAKPIEKPINTPLAQPSLGAKQKPRSFNDAMQITIDVMQGKAARGKLSLDDLSKMNDTVNRMEKEGAVKALTLFRNGDVQAGIDAFNSMGKYRGSKVVSSESGTTTKAGGGEEPTMFVTLQNPDGSIIKIDATQGLFQYEALKDQIAIGNDVKRLSLQKDSLKSTQDYHNRSLDIQEKDRKDRLGLSWAQFNAGTLAGQLQQKEKALGRPLSQEERNNMLGIDTMPQAVKMQAASLLKEQEQISQALNKAQAEGTFVETDKDGKPNPLMVRSASLNMQLGQLLNYKNKTNDPLGIMQPNPQGKAVSPQNGEVAPNVINPQKSKAPQAGSGLGALPPPKASDYKGESDVSRLYSNVKSGYGAVVNATSEFMSNRQSNIEAQQLHAVKTRMAQGLSLTDRQIELAIKNGLLRK